jgi:thioesterase domain-containing protein
MGADQPFYGLQSPGLDGETHPLGSVEEMAACYVAEMRRVQPEGPYLIGGWSLGGAIAYEAAQQLIQQGQEVALLAIIDYGIAGQSISPVESVEVEPVEVESVENEEIGEDMLIHLLEDYNLAPEVRYLPPDQQLAYLVKRAKELKRLPPDFEIEHAMRYLQVYKANVVACHMYLRKMRPYPDRITLFRATDDDDTPDDPAKGWRRFAQGGVEVYDVSGTHLSIVLEEQNARGLAEQLSQSISQAKGRRSEEPAGAAY